MLPKPMSAAPSAGALKGQWLRLQRQNPSARSRSNTSTGSPTSYLCLPVYSIDRPAGSMFCGTENAKQSQVQDAVP